MEPLASAIICDDLRMENNSKPFIIGIYTHAMVFTQLPAILGQMIVYVTVFSDYKNPISKFSVNIAGPGGLGFSQDFDLGKDFTTAPEISNPVRAEAQVVIPLRP